MVDNITVVIGNGALCIWSDMLSVIWYTLC